MIKKKAMVSTVVGILAFAAMASSSLPDVHINTVDAEVKGQWIGKFVTATNFAAKTHTPLILLYSRSGCDYCNQLKSALKGDTTSKFTAWMGGDGAKYVYCLSSESTAAKFAKPQGNSGFPFVSLWWNDGTDEIKKNYTARVSDDVSVNGRDPDKLAALIIDNATAFFKDYSDASDGRFVVGSTPSDRLEAAPNGGTMYVDVPLKREGSVAKALVNTLEATAAGNTTVYAVNWSAGEASKFVRVSVPGGMAAGSSIALTIKDANGKAVAISAITVVERETTPKNPLWFGERTAADLQAGEWSADRDLALSRASATGGATLTLIGGSLWCPDCVNADAYLVDTLPFKTWATGNSIYCAAIDVSAFPKGGKTCQLSYEPTTVSDRYVNATVPPQDRVQSGAGYLSRKMIPQTGNNGINASAIWARNLNLATNSIANGGLCRPECLDSANVDTGAWKTGVPCFIMQNANGRITGRLYQFSNVSPTDATSVAAYVQRLEELRQLADDPTEELNRHWLTATTPECEIGLRGGQVNSTISAIDTSDFWCIAGRDRWTRASFAVKGAAGVTGETNARLVLWRKSGTTAEKVASVEGNLATGFSLSSQEVSADASLAYFIQLEVLADSTAFALEHQGPSTVSYVLTSTAADDAGTVAFSRAGETVSEKVAKLAGGTVRVYAPLVRNGGASGSKTATVTIDASATTAFPDRYRLVSDAVTWGDGDQSAKSVAIDVIDDDNSDGTQALVLTVGGSSYTLTIEDNDTPNVGKLSIAGVAPALAKKGTVIAEEGSVIQIGVSRIGGASGDVGCTLATTAGEFESPTTLMWVSRESGEQIVKLRLPYLAEVKGGKVYVTFDSLVGITADSSTKKLTVQLVPYGAPRFETESRAFSMVRYCAVSETVGILDVTDGATVKVKKLSGKIPSGISVKVSGATLAISGTPTKAGLYEAVYQVSETVNRTSTSGLTVKLSFVVTDVSALDPAVPGANPSVAKSRTFGDQAIVDSDARRLVGILSSLTIPSTGKCSAKYKCVNGTVSLSTKSWSRYDDATGTLTAELADKTGLYLLEVNARPDGTVLIRLSDPEISDGVFEGEVAEGWSADNPATAWTGYYTVAVDSPDQSKTSGTVCAKGNPYLTLKLQSSLQTRKGTMSYAGVLPNGQSFSGSATLVRDGLATALLPVYYSKKSELFTLAPQIAAGGVAKAVNCGTEILPWWRHVGSSALDAYELCYTRMVGSCYDKNSDLITTLSPTAQGHEFAASDAISPLEVSFTSKKVSFAVPEAAKSVGATLTFSKSTGIVSGKFNVLNSEGKSVKATYKGVALPDWGDGCPSCGDIPWASGSFWFTDGGIKVGDVIYIESY